VLIEREDLSVLMAAVAEGDRLAFKHLYDRTSARLLGIVRRIVRDRPLAEEVLQEVYLRIWERAGTYRTEAGTALSWMISIARHRAIDVLRQRKEIVLAPLEDGEDWLERVAGPGDGETDLEDRDRLRHCLQRLEEPQRSCILLAYCDGYSRDELATRYEAPVNTIKTWLHRGLAVLRSCLEAP